MRSNNLPTSVATAKFNWIPVPHTFIRTLWLKPQRLCGFWQQWYELMTCNSETASHGFLTFFVAQKPFAVWKVMDPSQIVLVNEYIRLPRKLVILKCRSISDPIGICGPKGYVFINLNITLRVDLIRSSSSLKHVLRTN